MKGTNSVSEATQLKNADPELAEKITPTSTPQPADPAPERKIRLRRFIPRWDLGAPLTGLLGLLLSLAFVGVDLAYNQGEFVAPLDDVYIHLQYARQIGEGFFLQYNTGDPISTGASSLLYVLILGAAYDAGFQGDSFLPFAVGFGVFCLTVTVMCVYSLGKRLIGGQVGLWAALLVATSGPLLWGSTSGMEVGLVALLITGSALAFVIESPTSRYRLTPVIAALLAVTRPEGLIFAAALSGAMLWTFAGNVRRGDTTFALALRRFPRAFLPLAAGAGQLLYYHSVTGTTAANGVQAKSILYDRPVFYLTEAADRTSVNLHAFVETFGGLSNRDFAFPGAIFFVVLGIVYLIVDRPCWRAFTVAACLGCVANFVAVSTLSTAHVHHARYVQPLLPIFLLLAVVGVYGLTWFGTGGNASRARRITAHGLLAAALVFSVSMVSTWAVRLGRESATIRDTAVSVGTWVDRHLPPNATIGVKDVGAVKYFGNRQILDLIGLASNGMAEASNNGIGSLYEALARLPEERRPDYFALYDPAPGPPIEDLRESGVLGKTPLITFEVTVPEHPIENRVVPFTKLGIYRADWSLLETGDTQRVPGTTRDYLNVGDLVSEHEHDYAPQRVQVGVQPWSTVRRVELPDGTKAVHTGRYITGGETFTAHNLVPGRTLTITARSDLRRPEDSDDDVINPPDVQVLVNSERVGTWRRAKDARNPVIAVRPPKPPEPPRDPNEPPEKAVPPSELAAPEYTFVIPGELITGPSVTVELAPARNFLGPYPKYASFGYWFSQ